MQLPKYKKKNVVKLKVCREPGCGKEFWGHPIAKYCDLHRDIRKRTRIRKSPIDPDVENHVFNHSFSEVMDIEFKCPVKGCGKLFVVRVFPKQFIYPKFCDDHRTLYKRKLTERNYGKRNGPQIH